MIRLFAGLGNPGPDYKHTRHNAGFWWIDAVSPALAASGHGQELLRPGGAQFKQGANRVAAKPQTFMNLSGKSVAALAHDELDIAAGEAKLKLGGSHAGHNELRDVHAQLGTDQYWRLRLRIDHPGWLH